MAWNPKIVEEQRRSSWHRTLAFKWCALVVAAALTTMQLHTFFLDNKSLLSSKTLSISHPRNHSGAQSTGPNDSTKSSSSSLRFDWTNLTITSNFARAMQTHQSDYSLPLGEMRMRNQYGLGSDLHYWTQALCNGMQRHVRIQTKFPWIYIDNGVCGNRRQATAMLCYFPHSEVRCPSDRVALRQSIT